MNKCEFSDHSFMHFAVTRWQNSIHFLFIFGQCVDHCKQNLFLERNVGVTECPRSLNPRKAVAMVIFPITARFIAYRARSMHDVACEFACTVMMRSSNGCERP